jgi:alpha-ribazole phosphatase
VVTRLLLVRHGQTTWNGEARIQGQTDTALSDLGERQARRLGARLAGEAIDAAYASDLQRAWRTAEIALDGRPHEIVRDPAWRELHFGAWEGLVYDDAARRDPDLAKRRLRDPAHVAPPGGENLADLARRVLPAAQRLHTSHGGQTVVVVTHGGCVRVLVCTLLGLELNRAWHLHAANCGLTSVRWHEWGPVLELWNETHYLDGDGASGLTAQGPGGDRCRLALNVELGASKG